mgnify:CR=1 FL=1
MDRVVMRNLGFYGYHGVMPEENTLGQKFFLDIDMYADLKPAGNSDNVEDTIHYGEVYELVKDTVENKRFKLIEALAENIASSILENFSKVNEIKVRVKKPEAPVPGIYDYFGVEVRRSRNE